VLLPLTFAAAGSFEPDLFPAWSVFCFPGSATIRQEGLFLFSFPLKIPASLLAMAKAKGQSAGISIVNDWIKSFHVVNLEQTINRQSSSTTSLSVSFCTNAFPNA